MSKNYFDFYNRVEKMVGVFHVPHQDFEDVVQLVMLDIFDKKLIWETIGSKLLYVITRNAIVDRSRQEARNLRYIDKNMYFDSTGTVCDSSAGGLEVYTPIQEAQSKENELDTLIDCESLKPLSPPLHAVLELRLRGMIYSEIAKQLQISVGTVRSRLYHARRCNRANRQ